MIEHFLLLLTQVFLVIPAVLILHKNKSAPFCLQSLLFENSELDNYKGADIECIHNE